MANAPAGQYFLNGKDLFLIFGVIIQKKGTDDFLKFSDRKESITHDWQDANGTDVDLSRVFLQSKEIEMKCLLTAKSFDDYWKKYNGFFAEWITPGLKRFTISEFERSFFVYYKSTTNPERHTRLKNTSLVMFEFNLTVIEQEPTASTEVFLVDHLGRFIVT